MPKKPPLSASLLKRVLAVEEQALETLAQLEIEPTYYDDQPTGEELSPRMLQMLFLCRLLRRLGGAPALQIPRAIEAARVKLQAELDAELREPEE